MPVNPPPNMTTGSTAEALCASLLTSSPADLSRKSPHRAQAEGG
jgi:hypothetical protein